EKTRWIQPPFKVLQAIRDRVTLLLDRRDLQEFAVGDDGGNLLDWNDEDVLATPNRNSLEIWRLGQCLVRFDCRTDVRGLLRDDLRVLDALLRSIHRLSQSRFLDGFEQVVYGIDLECSHRIFVV